MTKTMKILAICSYLILIGIQSEAFGVGGGDEPLAVGELIITLKPGGVNPALRDISVDAIGRRWGLRAENYPRTNLYSHDEEFGPVFRMDHIESPAPGYRLFGYGKYSVGVFNDDTLRVVYVDFRDCDYIDGTETFGLGTNYDDVDLILEFDITNNSFSYKKDGEFL